jgi:very-short-patch-repair endonuclease
MINEMFINAVPIIKDTDIPPRSEIKLVDIRCSKCRKIKSLRVFRKSFLSLPYVCISCVKKGNANSFYGKYHSADSKRRIGGAVCDYNGNNNPFYGKHHSNEVISKLKSDPRCFHFSESNPFYGKHHDSETKEIIAQKNREFRINHPERVIENELKRLGKSKNDFLLMLNDYVMNIHNRNSIAEKYGVDFRTMKSWWLFFQLISSADLKRLTKYRQLNSNSSIPEAKLYNLLKDKFGEDNVKRCYELGGYYYDICLFEKVLVEYDGYYWHKIVKNKNDEIKNALAKDRGYCLFRVEESPNRVPNFDAVLSDIKTLLVSANLV